MPILWQGSPRCGRGGIALSVLLFAACDSGPTEPTLGSSWVAITTGYLHTCALTDAERAFCWGDNSAGQLGVPASDTGLATPTPVETTLRFIALSAGRALSCGVSADFAVYCWGEDAAQGRGGSPVPTCEQDGVTGPCPHVPTRVESDVEFISVSVAGAQRQWDGTVQGGPVCGLGTDGTAYCWGYGAFGARGDGTSRSTSTPTPLAGDLRFAEVAVDEGGGCGVTTSGDLYCWGTNAAYRLARDDRDYSFVPVEIISPEKWQSVSVGPRHTCAVTTAGEARCWGMNWYGQLGDGSTEYRSSATLVRGQLVLSAIEVGSSHTCALDQSGIASCWGATAYTGTGQAVAIRRSILVPIPVAWSQPLISISASAYQTCGVTPAGQGYCWGSTIRAPIRPP